MKHILITSKKQLLTFLTLILFVISYAQKKPKILISVDMEGIAGVVTEQQLGPSGFEYNRFREFTTNEALAAIKGARAAGAGEIIVADAHGNGQNLLIEKFPEDVKIIRSWPRRFGMIAGIDDSIDGVILIGYHSATSNKEGVRAHTFSSAKLTDVKLNGESISEGIWAAQLAGSFNVPIILVTGDDIVTKEMSDYLSGNIETAVVKTALGFHSALTITPQAAEKIIYESSKKSIQNLKAYKPVKISGPVTCEVSFKNYRVSEVLDYLPIFERVNSHTIKFSGKDMTEIADIFLFIIEYSSNLNP